MGVFNPGDHGSTFGGNPLGAAVAQAALEVLLEEDLPGRAFELGSYFMDGLRSMHSPYVQEIRAGACSSAWRSRRNMARPAPFCERLMEEGLLCKETHEQTIRFAPPLVITQRGDRLGPRAHPKGACSLEEEQNYAGNGDECSQYFLGEHFFFEEQHAERDDQNWRQG